MTSDGAPLPTDPVTGRRGPLARIGTLNPSLESASRSLMRRKPANPGTLNLKEMHCGVPETTWYCRVSTRWFVSFSELALAVVTWAELPADGPGPGHRALLPGRHLSGEHIPANAAAGATSSSSAAPAVHNKTCRL